MKVRAGQILQPDPEAIVRALAVAEEHIWIIQAAAADILQPVAQPVVIQAAHHIPAPAVLRLADVAADGLTLAHALVDNLRRKGAIMYQLQAVGQDGILTQLLALAVNQPQPLAQELAVVLDHAPLDLTG